jgi:hypothetical protein
MNCEWHISESLSQYMEYIFCIAHSLDLVGVYSMEHCEYALNCSFMFFIILCFLDIVLAKVFVLTSQTAKVSHKKWYKISTNLEELPEDADAR